ncbi:MAG: hypothetical protein Q4B03_01115 [Lachnospiraceae bacterium]|nr:hypothetical protein [Lachnospiraceae bacterium]
MESLYSIYQSFDISGTVSTYYPEYRHTLLIILLVIALLNCFFGYYLRKLWGILAGMLIGALIAATACIYLGRSGLILYIVTGLGAFILGLLALLLYKIGLFFLCLVLVPYIFSRLFPAPTLESVVLWIILGAVAGILTLVRERDVISILTAVGGGFGSGMVILMLWEHESTSLLVLFGIALSVFGLFLQFQLWRSRSDWNSDEERTRDKLRHKRRMRRIRNRRKRKEQAAQRKKHADHRRSGSAPRRTTSEYTPLNTRPIGQRSAKQQGTAGSERFRSYGHDFFESAREETDIGSTGTIPAVPRPADPDEPKHFTADLSDVRQSISREVSDIFLEQQELDEKMNRILEQDLHDSTRKL